MVSFKIHESGSKQKREVNEYTNGSRVKEGGVTSVGSASIKSVRNQLNVTTVTSMLLASR